VATPFDSADASLPFMRRLGVVLCLPAYLVRVLVAPQFPKASDRAAGATDWIAAAGGGFDCFT